MANKSSSSKIQELKKELAELQDRYNQLEIDRDKLYIVCRENDLIEDAKEVSDTEAICVAEIRKLREKTLHSELTESDTKRLDLLFKNLRIAKGIVVNVDNSKAAKKSSTAELLRLVDGEKA